jgi:hypothetical protein
MAGCSNCAIDCDLQGKYPNNNPIKTLAARARFFNILLIITSEYEILLPTDIKSAEQRLPFPKAFQ